MTREEEIRKALDDARREERDEEAESKEERPSNYQTPVKLGFFKKIKMAMFNPSYLFESVRYEGMGGAAGFHFVMNLIGVMILGVFIFSIGTVLTSMFTSIPFMSVFSGIFMMFFSAMFVFVAIIIMVGVVVGNFIGACILHIFLKLVGGKGGYNATYKSTSYAAAPMIFLGIPFLNFISAVWSIVIAIVGLSSLHKISRARAAAAFFMPVVIVTIIMAYLIMTSGISNLLLFKPNIGFNATFS